MQLGFVTAILPTLGLEEILQFAAGERFDCIEVMCWPPGKSDRRYAGVTHIDVTDWSHAKAQSILQVTQKYGVAISALGYYPNPLDPNPQVRETIVEHLKKVIQVSPSLGLKTVNTFIGRDHTRNIEENLLLMKEVWSPIMELAHKTGVRIAIEHCPMLFSNDEWPGGKNLPVSPHLWREMFRMFPEGLGLNIDPSHLIWQGIDAARAIREFKDKIFHVHAKDERIDQDLLYEQGISGLHWHLPKLPGLGDVQWGPFFSALTDAGYHGPVCIEVEDRAYEKTLEDRKRALRQSRNYLSQFFG
ncbi:sugar phosphate isomerase/epimerase [Telmatocola sphagniphila]|uniref:Sugar phosphate isomerase/epimerase n=1 Tax=Telmatocola sphagniphila TaxID=1123043 RepID=A0A8E6EVW9_9BACT|nr:sugar phosphate isomerase/epimerase [Telmatocola sphagniphila]QVL33157.1 sugar phosphate isomerase/epimerase [Telmatocola sphagniphila]